MRISSQFTIVWKRVTCKSSLHSSDSPCTTDCSSLLVKGYCHQGRNAPVNPSLLTLYSATLSQLV